VGATQPLAGKSIGQGRERVREALLANAELRGAVELATYEKLPGCMRRLEQRAA